VKIDVQQCIGCGAIATPQPCLGTCVDRRLDLVAADQHALAQSAVEVMETTRTQRRDLLDELVRSPLTPSDWQSLRARARSALRQPPAAAAAAVITTWACDSCGRIEAPQPCIGLCVRPAVTMVPATEHQDLLTRAGELADTLARLAVPLRQLAWTTPRPDAWEASVRALRASAVEQVIEADLARIDR